MPKARVPRGVSKQLNWCFEPSYCRPPAVEYTTPNEATDALTRSLRSSWYKDMIRTPAYMTELPVQAAADRTHDHLFGSDLPPPPAVVHRRRDAGDGCDGPCWSPSDCQRPPSVDDFTRTQRNIHGGDQPTLKPAPPADFNSPRTTILGLHLLPPVCCPHPGASTSPVINEQFERTKYNIIGPQKLAPLRFPVRIDDFINSKHNLFEPATTVPVPLRFPQRTSAFEDTKRNVFGPHLPFTARQSQQPQENTFDHLFGKTILNAPRTVTPPLPLRQNINVFSMTGRSQTPPRFQPRPEISFGNTYNHLFGRETPVIPKSEHRQVLLPSSLSTF